MTVKDIADHLERYAPRPYQESYDNSGLLTGDLTAEVTGILVTLDCTEEVVSEAIEKKCNLVVAHHPIIFKGLKKLTGSNYVERTVLMAIRNNVAIYAAHTNLDNVHNGVNKRICDRLGLINTRVLSPKKGVLSKLVTFIPKDNTGDVLQAMHQAGAGQIGKYSNCSFRVEGTGSFKPDADADPHIGQTGKQEWVTEDRVEVIFPSYLESRVLAALRKAHPYEEIAYYLTVLDNENQEIGAGMVGELPVPVDTLDFLHKLKKQMHAPVVKHTALLRQPVVRVAVCGGSGSFLLQEAIRAGAQVFVSSDFKYHEFFDAEGRITIADIGHYESEVFTKDLIMEVLTKKFPNFAINFSTTVTNPISYL